MGEKGNTVEDLGSVVAVAAAADPSLIEKVTTTTTHEVIGVGEDIASKIRDKAVESAADNVIAEGRDRLHRNPDGAAAAATDEPPPQA